MLAIGMNFMEVHDDAWWLGFEDVAEAG